MMDQFNITGTFRVRFNTTGVPEVVTITDYRAEKAAEGAPC